MTKTTMYTYLGTNGIITSPVHLEGIYFIKKVRLEADENKVLTRDGGKTTSKAVTVPEDEVGLWKEVYKKVSS
jgi:hypothetical protein